MFRFSKLGFAALTLGTGLFAAGCASNAPAQSSMETTPTGITCTKCQVTWVATPRGSGNDKGQIKTYAWGKKDTCPDCRDAVQSFVNTGKFEHTCKTCGDAMNVCTTHEMK
jgi:hypothetical protein